MEFLFSNHADKRVIFQRSTTNKKSIFTWEYLLELLLYTLWANGTLINRSVSTANFFILLENNCKDGNEIGFFLCNYELETNIYRFYFRRGEVTEEYIVDMQSADINRFGGQPSIVLQPLSNNTQIQKTKYYDNEVSTRTSLFNYSDIACGRFDSIKIINDVFNFI